MMSDRTFQETLNEAVRVIRMGGTILYPTDTIWGIGCDATNPAAVQRVYDIKQRPDRKSMLVLMHDPVMLEEYLDRVPENVPDLIRKAKRPTTIIYPGCRNLAGNLPSDDGSIGIRITGDPFCRMLIQETGRPVVSTSANVSGQHAPGNFREISEGILNLVDYVVQWRQQEETRAAPSTILKLDANGGTTVIRP